MYTYSNSIVGLSDSVDCSEDDNFSFVKNDLDKVYSILYMVCDTMQPNKLPAFSTDDVFHDLRIRLCYQLHTVAELMVFPTFLRMKMNSLFLMIFYNNRVI